MEEYNLFLKLNTLNNLINDDILLIDKCSAELSLKQETENKLTVQKRLLSLLEENNVITKRTEEKISQLEKDRLNQERELKEKDEIILKANNKVKEVMSDNKNLEISLNNVKCKLILNDILSIWLSLCY
jgi:hypothetical protein